MIDQVAKDISGTCHLKEAVRTWTVDEKGIRRLVNSRRRFWHATLTIV